MKIYIDINQECIECLFYRRQELNNQDRCILYDAYLDSQKLEIKCSDCVDQKLIECPTITLVRSNGNELVLRDVFVDLAKMKGNLSNSHDHIKIEYDGFEWSTSVADALYKLNRMKVNKK